MFELMDGYSETAVIKVLGVGGGGGNAVAHMVRTGIEGVDFICANTDAQALKNSKVKTALQIGCNITKGLGAGANPEVGRQAAMEDRDRISSRDRRRRHAVHHRRAWAAAPARARRRSSRSSRRRWASSPLPSSRSRSRWKAQSACASRSRASPSSRGTSTR